MKKASNDKRIGWKVFFDKPWALVLVCYVVAIVGVFAVKTFYFVSDKISVANGSLVQTTLVPEDFDLVALEPIGGGVYQSIDADPQMILIELPTKVRNLTLRTTYSSKPLEIDLYYTTKLGQDFGKTMRVWPVIQADGSYLFTLPHESIQSLRLDPASAAVKIEFEEISLNQPQSAIQYFNPGWSGLVLLLVLPAFAAAILRWIISVVQYCKWKKKSLESKQD